MLGVRAAADLCWPDITPSRDAGGPAPPGAGRRGAAVATTDPIALVASLCASCRGVDALHALKKQPMVLLDTAGPAPAGSSTDVRGDSTPPDSQSSAQNETPGTSTCRTRPRFVHVRQSRPIQTSAAPHKRVPARRLQKCFVFNALVVMNGRR